MDQLATIAALWVGGVVFFAAATFARTHWVFVGDDRRRVQVVGAAVSVAALIGVPVAIIAILQSAPAWMALQPLSLIGLLWLRQRSDVRAIALRLRDQAGVVADRRVTAPRLAGAFAVATGLCASIVLAARYISLARGLVGALAIGAMFLMVTGTWPMYRRTPMRAAVAVGITLGVSIAALERLAGAVAR